MMAVLDDEATDAERQEFDLHLAQCWHCNEEFNDYQQFHQLIQIPTAAALPADFTWDTYYRGVCRKMESRGSWIAWSLVSLLLVTVGSLMILGFPRNLMATAVGLIALLAGAGLILTSYLCNCPPKS